MSVVIGDVYALVSNTVSDCDSGESHINQMRNVAVSDVVDSDTFHACLLGTSVHFSVQIAFRDSKHPLVLANVIEHFEIIFHLVCQELRHFDDTITLFRLGCGDEILSVQTLIRFVDGYCVFLKIEVGGSEG